MTDSFARSKKTAALLLYTEQFESIRTLELHDNISQNSFDGKTGKGRQRPREINSTDEDLTDLD